MRLVPLAASVFLSIAASAVLARAAEGGARGIVFGRNIFQSRNPAGFIQALRAIMGGKSTIDAALKAYDLEKA